MTAMTFLLWPSLFWLLLQATPVTATSHGVILVVGMRLGCINHALLSAEAIARDGLKLAGWVANQPGETMPCYAENLDTLRDRLSAPLLGEIPAMSPFDVKEAAGSLCIPDLLSK